MNTETKEPHPDAPCMDYLPTLGEKWPHSRGNVGKYSLHGASGAGHGPVGEKTAGHVRGLMFGPYVDRRAQDGEGGCVMGRLEQQTSR